MTRMPIIVLFLITARVARRKRAIGLFLSMVRNLPRRQ